MPIRWDALLVRHTAIELDRLLAGARLRGLRLDHRSREMALLFRDRTVLWRLHPSHGDPLVFGPLDGAADVLRLRARVRHVHAPPDERLVRFELVRPGGAGAPLAVIVELVGTRWNALVTEGSPAVIRHVLRRRGGGSRPQTVGEPYVPPRPPVRSGRAPGEVSLADWLDTLAPQAPEARSGVLVRTFAWTSPLNAAALLGTERGGEDASALEIGYDRWIRFADAETPAVPVILEGPGAQQPYPFPLPGTPSRAVQSLMDGFASCAAGVERPVSATPEPELVRELERVTREARQRVTRLEREVEQLPDPNALRERGDLLLARHSEIPRGVKEVVLDDFEGRRTRVELDPSRPVHESADAYYRRASKAERARERVPELLEGARADHRRLAQLLAEARAGEVDAEVIRSALPPVSRSGDRAGGSPSLPYRTFKSSGGLEIRVGRGARQNDDLTFRHSAPGDVWLHARHAAGAHVVLRWNRPGAPPGRDLREAATLAALHSKARTSGSVPVDWTLRKYVRKPRGAAPGRVSCERLKTLFVDPDPTLAGAEIG